MSMRRNQLLATGVGLAALLIASTPASAATTWSVKAGSAAKGTTVAITGTSQGTSPQITFKDTTTGQTLTCASSTAPGTTKTGSGLAGAGIGKITGASVKFTTCTGPLGLKFTVTGTGTWLINAASYASGKTTGTISAVSATVTDPGVCTFKVTGSVAATYTNSTQILAVPGTTSTLTISSVTGCLGIIANNNKASFKANYKLKANTAANNPVSITSP